MIKNAALQQSASVIQAIVSGGQPKVAGAVLNPLPLGKIGAHLFVNNTYSDDWWDDIRFAQLVAHVAKAYGLPIEYTGHQVVGRSREMFKPFTDVEVFVCWEPLGHDDELLNDPVASCGVAALPTPENSGLVWGWLPGHVLETNEHDVVLKLMRRAWLTSLNKYSSIVTVPLNEPMLRIVKKRGLVPVAGEAHA